MIEKRKIGLSSLAISVSVMALLGISGVATADPPPADHCAYGVACDIFVLDQIQQGPDAPPLHPWDLPSHYDIGFCGRPDGSQGACGCSGWAHTQLWIDNRPSIPYLYYAGIIQDYFVFVPSPPAPYVDQCYVE